MSEKLVPTFLVDGVQSIAINNGIARIMLMRLDITGKPTQNVELHIPMNQVASIAEALQRIR